MIWNRASIRAQGGILALIPVIAVIVSFVFALFVGLLTRIIAFYLFDIGIVRRLNRLTENVRAITCGEAFLPPLPKKDDAIGLLEQEIVKIGEKYDLDTKSEQ